ncbi:MAG TPA: hypothetical protein VLF66_18825, partial [Thermoanaerobaculia bacterium]|nr:hypothetical protein [Thermoanaerobaculia bacterium]
MSSITDLFGEVGKRLAQGFLSLDDLVAGRSLVSGTLEGAARTGRAVLGTAAASTQLAARSMFLGVQVGAKTARATAASLRGLPGIGLLGLRPAEEWAGRLDDRATAAGAESSRLAARSAELAGGAAAAPRNPLTQEPWLAQGAPPGYSWPQLAADTALGPLWRGAALPAAAAADALCFAAGTAPARWTGRITLRGANALLDLWPGGGRDGGAGRSQTAELRESFVALVSGSGLRVPEALATFTEANARLAFGDLRAVRRTLPEALAELASVAASGSERGGWVTGSVPGLLRRVARSVSQRAPVGVAAALERWHGLSDSGPVLGALLDDATELAVFAAGYPGFVALAALDDGTLLAMGLTDAGRVGRWVREDGVEGRRSGDGGAAGAAGQASKPELVALCESVLGRPEEGVAPGFHPEPTVDLAQDVAFGYSRDALGRERALARVERLFGTRVRERIEADVSLDPELLDTRDRRRVLRYRIESLATGGELARARELCAARLGSLERFSRLRWVYVPRQVRRRSELLRDFVSLANQDLALRSAASAEATAER